MTVRQRRSWLVARRVESLVDSDAASRPKSLSGGHLKVEPMAGIDPAMPCYETITAFDSNQLIPARALLP